VGRTTPRKALTLPELVMAVSITALVGLAVATVASALSYAHGRSDAMRESIQSARMAMMRTGAELRKARLVGCAADGRIVLWAGDADEDGDINVSEVVLVRYDDEEATVEQWQVVFPPSMPPETREALDVALTVEQLADGAAVEAYISQATYAGYLAQWVLAAEVADFETGWDAAPPETRLVTLRLAVGPADQRMTLSTAVRLRAATGGPA